MRLQAKKMTWIRFFVVLWNSSTHRDNPQSSGLVKSEGKEEEELDGDGRGTAKTARGRGGADGMFHFDWDWEQAKAIGGVC